MPLSMHNHSSSFKQNDLSILSWLTGGISTSSNVVEISAEMHGDVAARLQDSAAGCQFPELRGAQVDPASSG